MFGRKMKLYKIIYETCERFNIIIEAKDEIRALKKFRKLTQPGLAYAHMRIISFEEYKISE